MPEFVLELHYYKVLVEKTLEWCSATGDDGFDESRMRHVFHEIDYREELFMEYELRTQMQLSRFGQRNAKNEFIISSELLSFLRQQQFPFLESIADDETRFWKRHVIKAVLLEK